MLVIMQLRPVAQDETGSGNWDYGAFEVRDNS
jgi:hypothetical protein